MIYPQKLNSKKSNIIVKFGIIISFTFAIVLTIINRCICPQIHWSAIVNSGILYVWIILFYSIKKNINIAGHVLLHAIAISILNIYIDYEIGFKGWSLNIGIPVIVIISNITMLIITIIRYKQFIKYAVYQIIIVFFSIIPFILLTENMLQNKTLIIIATIISILNFIVSLILCTKDVKEALIRKFHI